MPEFVVTMNGSRPVRVKIVVEAETQLAAEQKALKALPLGDYESWNEGDAEGFEIETTEEVRE